MTQPGAQPTDRLAGFDFAAHNAEAKEAWAAFRGGTPTRAPVIVGTTTRYFMESREANPEGLTFREYTEDPDVMFDAQLRFARWRGFNILQDAELGLGLPERWQVSVDYQNYWEPAWFGCPVEYIGGEVPDTRPAFADAPERVMEAGLPDPFGGIMARGLEYHQRFVERAKSETYLDRPIEVLPPWYGCGYNGPMTVACALFGPDWTCLAMAAEPERLQTLLSFITDATVARMEAWRRLCGVPIPEEGAGGMDDSIAMISVPMFREHVLPHLARLYNHFGTPGPRSIHLCGDATRHFPLLQRELNIQTFDTGFPVDFARVRRELGPGATIQGGPHVELLRSASPQAVYEETARILGSGILEGLFILREGNNLAPGTPLENTEAMYRAGRELGAQGG